jgi:KaiB-like protein
MALEPATDVVYHFVLFVAGSEPNSMVAREKLDYLVAEFLRLRNCSVRIVDITKEFAVAMEYNVVFSPTLIVDGPRGRSVLVGNLTDIDRILLTLGCNA